MDLTTFRAQYPGLYQKAVDKGAALERQRCEDIAKLAIVAGAPADIVLAAIESGANAAELVPQLNAYAGQSDQTAAAFKQKTLAMGLGLATSPRGSDDAEVDALIARLPGANQPGVVTRGPKDLGDLFAESLPPPGARRSGGAVTTNPRPPTSGPRPEASEPDLSDLFAADLPPPRAVGGRAVSR